MFYCDDCAKKKGWNMTMFKSVGPCEVCGKTKECSDLPCKQLTEEPMFSNKQKAAKG